MRFNSQCTVWHYDGSAYSVSHYPCWWQGTDAVNISKSSSDKVDTALVFLPVDAAVYKNDYIAIGNVTYVPTNAGDLLKNVNVLKIMSVSVMNYGSARARHTEVSCR